jgi:hypothetical protein
LDDKYWYTTSRAPGDVVWPPVGLLSLSDTLCQIRLPRRRVVLLFVLTLVVVTPVAVPVLAGDSGQATVRNEMPNHAPTSCIDASGEPQSVAGEPPALIGELSIVNHSNSTVRIEFDRVPNRSIGGERLVLQFQQFTNVSATHGFRERFAGSYHWDGRSGGWIEYQVQNVSNERFTIDLTNQTQERTIIPIPDYGGSVPIKFKPTGDGYVGSRFAYLGSYTTTAKTVGCQEIKLVVPTNTELPAPPEEILDTLAGTARRLAVGHAYDQVRVFVSPTSIGTADGFVRDRDTEDDLGPEIVIHHDAPFDGPDWFAWRHEYIHTRQGFDVADDLKWIQEASAQYLAYRTAIDSGAIAPRQYDWLLNNHYHAQFSDKLATNATDGVAYIWGPVVLSRVDEGLRARSNRTFVDTLGWLNSRGEAHEQVSLSTFGNRTVGENSSFNLTTVVYGEPPVPGFEVAPEWLPNWIQLFWFPPWRVLPGLVYFFSVVFWVAEVRDCYVFYRSEG